VRTEALCAGAEKLRRWGPVIVGLAIAAAIPRGGREGLTAARLGVALLALLWAGSAACKVASALATIAKSKARITGMDSFLEPPGAVRAGPVLRLGGIKTVDFEGVSFAYPRAPAPSLAGVSFQLRRGDCLAIAGPSGSGKTTLIRLLTGVDHPTGGAVRVNGIDLRAEDTPDYRRRIGAVFQDEVIEVATIRRVILGMAPIPEERAWEAARMARIADMITNLPMGMQTMVAPLTVPSAFLHQLLIARALARQPEMLVLDEALSNLDADVQSGLISDLRHSGMTVVICTHRPSTMALADRVIRLERGGIVA
jgi:ABC-type multidrug transport system fused ATPase/permease subunit